MLGFAFGSAPTYKSPASPRDGTFRIELFVEVRRAATCIEVRRLALSVAKPNAGTFALAARSELRDVGLRLWLSANLRERPNAGTFELAARFELRDVGLRFAQRQPTRANSAVASALAARSELRDVGLRLRSAPTYESKQRRGTGTRREI